MAGALAPKRLLTRALLMAVAAALIGLVAAGSARAATSGFVSESGGQLMLGGQPFDFVGFNDYELTSMPNVSGTSYAGCGTPLGVGDDPSVADAYTDPQLDQLLYEISRGGATVVRTWFFQSFYDAALQNGSGDPFAPFDRVLKAAAFYGLKVVPVLVNEWTGNDQNCEPQSVTKNLGFFQGGYEQPNTYGYPLSFQRYAKTIAQHYATNTTIAFWQLGNELYSDSPSGCDAAAGTETTAEAALQGFAQNMTATIKSVDPNHLVSLGTMGTGQCGLRGGDYTKVNSAVDICDYHDDDAGYSNPLGGTTAPWDASSPIPNDGVNRLQQRIDQCAAQGEPLVVTEGGLPADIQPTTPGVGALGGTETAQAPDGVGAAANPAPYPITTATLQNRANLFAAKMTAAFQAGVSGYLLWNLEPTASVSQVNPWTSPSQPGNYDFNVGPDASGTTDPTNAVLAGEAAALRGTLALQTQSTPNMQNGVDGTALNRLSGVSCPGGATCEAVGYTGGPASATPLAESWNGGVWSPQTLPAPSTAAASTLIDAISCSSTTNCMAVGSYTGYPCTNYGGSAAIGFCAGIGTPATPSGPTGTWPIAETWNGSSWSIMRPFPRFPSGSTNTSLGAVSCPSATLCVAAGQRVATAGSGQPTAWTEWWNGSSWSQAAVFPTGAYSSGLSGVSCASTTSCTAVGWVITAPGQPRTPLAEAFDGTSWTVAAAATPAGALGSTLNGVSCAAGGRCTAVGTYLAGNGPTDTLVEALGPGAATVVASPNPAGSGGFGSQLYGVGCGLVSGACVATGWYMPASGATVPLALKWNGSGWSQLAVPVPDASRDPKDTGDLDGGVSCDATNCTAVGAWFDNVGDGGAANSDAYTLAERSLGLG
jgi:hypothetical protein